MGFPSSLEPWEGRWAGSPKRVRVGGDATPGGLQDEPLNQDMLVRPVELDEAWRVYPLIPGYPQVAFGGLGLERGRHHR